jgi:hypothetical protein
MKRDVNIKEAEDNEQMLPYLYMEKMKGKKNKRFSRNM